jgi:hypothetical protein
VLTRAATSLDAEDWKAVTGRLPKR